MLPTKCGAGRRGEETKDENTGYSRREESVGKCRLKNKKKVELDENTADSICPLVGYVGYFDRDVICWLVFRTIKLPQPYK